MDESRAGDKMDRLGFLRLAAMGMAGFAAGMLGGCSPMPASSAVVSGSFAEYTSDSGESPALSADDLPMAEPNLDGQFGVDRNINMETIDNFLNIPGVCYRDMRLVQDPARYEVIGGNSELSISLPGFRVTPYPYLGTLAPLPVQGAYDGPALYDVQWAEEGLSVVEARPRYTQSLQILQELFPKEAPVFIICGGAGYAAMTRALLAYLGWDPSRLYVVGGVWDYNGENPVQLVSYADPDNPEYYFWRTDVAYFDFGLLHLVE